MNKRERERERESNCHEEKHYNTVLGVEEKQHFLHTMQEQKIHRRAS